MPRSGISMPFYDASFIRSLGFETIGDDVIHGVGVDRRLIGSAGADGKVSLTDEGVELVAARKIDSPPEAAAKTVDEMIDYAYTAFGVKLDKRKNLQTLKQQVAELEQQESKTE